MKSRASSSKRALLAKDMSRFFPLWGGYTLCLLAGLFLLGNDDLGYWFAWNIASGINMMAVVNCGYALVAAAALFGDLYSSRMCNALHAMPVQRQTWFSVHVKAGFWFSLIPTAIMTAVALPFMRYSVVKDAWQIPLLWFATVNLQYLFFFGLAAFCALCAGNRVGLAALYGSLNLGSLLVFFLVESLYVPLLPGVLLRPSNFTILNPMAYLVGENMIFVEREQVGSQLLAGGDEMQLYTGWFTINWRQVQYLLVLVVIGILLLLLARRKYRRRDLECAGDLAASRGIARVIGVLLALSSAALAHFLVEIFGFTNGLVTTTLVVAGLGLVAGWFGGRMLLEKSPRVFGWKSWLGLSALTLLLAGSLGLTWMDPLGVGSYIPPREQVESAMLDLSYGASVTLEEPEQIQDLMRIHALALEDRLEGSMEAVNVMPDIKSGLAPGETPNSVYIRLSYQLKWGYEIQREYYIWMEGEAGDLVRAYAGSLEGVVGYWDGDIIETRQQLLATEPYLFRVRVDGVTVEEDALTAQSRRALLNAIADDCQEGNLVPHVTYHMDAAKEDSKWYYTLELIYEDKTNLYIQLFDDSHHTIAWAEATGVMEKVRDPEYRNWG